MKKRDNLCFRRDQTPWATWSCYLYQVALGKGWLARSPTSAQVAPRKDQLFQRPIWDPEPLSWAGESRPGIQFDPNPFATKLGSCSTSAKFNIFYSVVSVTGRNLWGNGFNGSICSTLSESPWNLEQLAQHPRPQGQVVMSALTYLHYPMASEVAFRTEIRHFREMEFLATILSTVVIHPVIRPEMSLPQRTGLCRPVRGPKYLKTLLPANDSSWLLVREMSWWCLRDEPGSEACRRARSVWQWICEELFIPF